MHGAIIADVMEWFDFWFGFDFGVELVVIDFFTIRKL